MRRAFLFCIVEIFLKSGLKEGSRVLVRASVLVLLQCPVSVEVWEEHLSSHWTHFIISKSHSSKTSLVSKPKLQVTGSSQAHRGDYEISKILIFARSELSFRAHLVHFWDNVSQKPKFVIFSIKNGVPWKVAGSAAGRWPHSAASSRPPRAALPILSHGGLKRCVVKGQVLLQLFCTVSSRILLNETSFWGWCMVVIPGWGHCWVRAEVPARPACGGPIVSMGSLWKQFKIVTSLSGQSISGLSNLSCGLIR